MSIYYVTNYNSDQNSVPYFEQKDFFTICYTITLYNYKEYLNPPSPSNFFYDFHRKEILKSRDNIWMILLFYFKYAHAKNLLHDNPLYIASSYKMTTH